MPRKGPSRLGFPGKLAGNANTLGNNKRRLSWATAPPRAVPRALPQHLQGEPDSPRGQQRTEVGPGEGGRQRQHHHGPLPLGGGPVRPPSLPRLEGRRVPLISPPRDRSGNRPSLVQSHIASVESAPGFWGQCPIPYRWDWNSYPSLSRGLPRAERQGGSALRPPPTYWALSHQEHGQDQRTPRQPGDSLPPVPHGLPPTGHRPAQRRPRPRSSRCTTSRLLSWPQRRKGARGLLFTTPPPLGSN